MATLSPYGFKNPEQTYKNIKNVSNAVVGGIGAVQKGAADYIQYVDTSSKRNRLIEELVGLDPKLAAKREAMQRMSPDELVGKAFMLKTVKDKIENTKKKYENDVDEAGNKQTYMAPSLVNFFELPESKVQDILASLDDTDKTYGLAADQRLTRRQMSVIEGLKGANSVEVIGALNKQFGEDRPKQVAEYIKAMQAREANEAAKIRAQMTGNKIGSDIELNSAKFVADAAKSEGQLYKEKENVRMAQQKFAIETGKIADALNRDGTAMLGSREYDESGTIAMQYDKLKNANPEEARKLLRAFNLGIKERREKANNDYNKELLRYGDLINSLAATKQQIAGKRGIRTEQPVPKGAGTIVPGSIAMPDTTTPVTEETIPAPKTQEEYNAIPSGSLYIDTDGTKKRKK